MNSWMTDTTEQGRLMQLGILSRGLVQRPDVYGVAPDVAGEALRLVEEAEAAMELAMAPATRTKLAIAEKTAKLHAAIKYCTRLVPFIRANPNISDADRLAIAVPPPAEKRRIPPPTTRPILAIGGIIPGGHDMRIYDETSPNRCGRAPDTKGMELIVAYSPNLGDAGLGLEQIIKTGAVHGVVTRGRSNVIHPDERVGSMANYIGRWLNARGEAGPWSNAVRMLLAMPSEARQRSAA